LQLFLKYRSKIFLNIISGFVNAVYFHRNRPHTQKDSPRPHEVDIYSSQN
jgi:hypothetical protein